MASVIHLYYSTGYKCPHIFATREYDSSVILPPTTLHDCPKCNKTHMFSKRSGFLASTLSQQNSLKELAEKLGVAEFDVALNL